MKTKILLLSFLLGTFQLVQAQGETETVPALSEMEGDFVIMNMQEYEGMAGLGNMRAMKMSVDGDSLSISGFYMLQGVDNVKAGYDEQDGDITISSGTEILRASNITRVLYVWDEDAQEVNLRPITYEYLGNGTWATEQTLMIMTGYVGGELSQGAYFANGSEIHRANAVSSNVSYYGTDIETQERYDESRPSFVAVEDGRVAVYNLLQADQYGYGCMMEGTIGTDGATVSFAPRAIGQTNDGTYRVLAGCGYDEAGNIPDGLTNAGTPQEGYVEGHLDLETGTLSFGHMAIWVASYDGTGLEIDSDRFFEFVAKTEVTFEPGEILPSSIGPSRALDSQAKAVERVEYYRMDGVRVARPRQGELLVKRSVYTDGTARTEKMFVR